jgi:hypothetical protein
MAPQLIYTQPEITVAMRPILFDFLLDVHTRLKLTAGSFYLTISIIDRYSSLRVVRKDHFQLLGLTCLWIAAKFTDAKPKVPTLAFLRATCCNCYPQALFLEMECHVLKSLEWEVDAPTHDSYIDLILLEKQQNNQLTEQSVNSVKQMANYICQLMQFHNRCTFASTVSQIALASIIISTHSLTFQEEKLFVAHESTQTPNMERLIDTMLMILRDPSVPAAIKSKFYNKTMASPLVRPIHSYANEQYRRQQMFVPKTPFYYYQTPPVSRQGSNSDSDSVFSSRGSLSSYGTPQSSGTASPVEMMKPAEFRILTPRAPRQTHKTTYDTALHRKRSLDD